MGRRLRLRFGLLFRWAKDDSVFSRPGLVEDFHGEYSDCTHDALTENGVIEVALHASAASIRGGFPMPVGSSCTGYCRTAIGAFYLLHSQAQSLQYTAVYFTTFMVYIPFRMCRAYHMVSSQHRVASFPYSIVPVPH